MFLFLGNICPVGRRQATTGDTPSRFPVQVAQGAEQEIKELQVMQSFVYTIKDEIGIHARPAGMLAKEAKKFSPMSAV